MSHPAANSQPVAFSPSVERIDEDEQKVFADLDQTLSKIREKTFEDSGHARRSVHAKAHGVLRARLSVLSGLPDTLAQGLFAQAGEYDVLMRFSTNPGDVLHDKVSVPRGLAVKVFGVPGERLAGSEGDVTQNFVFADAPAFSAPTAKKFLANLKPLAATTDVAEGAKKALSATMRVAERVVEAFGGESSTLISMGGHPMTHVLGASFYSGAALRYGRYIAKFALVPVSAELAALADQEVDLDDRPDGLREEVVSFARSHRMEWELRVQLCTDLESMPIEDASVPWPEDQSPYVAVARIVAEPQAAWSEAIQKVSEDGMFFSPWRGLAAHQPLGNVMRSRKAAYEQSARFRAERNGTPVTEPADLSTFPL
ncbi:MAG: catalase [Pseudomonas sp.]|uniref:catalase family protein n=1 Tax=Pseudomonas sp. TaxID=306 RepID=UPI0011FE1CBE|nr:catalase family protein [Pseudomonas sp.]RZI76857.1 MAG: catalase [Pseudomonas sp.]